MRLTRVAILLLAGVLASVAATKPLAQELSHQALSADSDKKNCQLNLGLIYEAIQEYRFRHQKLPDRLSDLAPEWIFERQTLICPFVRKTELKVWRRKTRDLAGDSRTSYSYEFPPTEIESSLWRGFPRRTWRELKELQRQRVGGVVPIVRCQAHLPTVLNLAYDGRIYESESYWEARNPAGTFDIESLQAHKLFADRAEMRSVSVGDFPPRDSSADRTLLDLSNHYNALLNDGWQGFPGNHLGQLPIGIQKLDGTLFDIRGLIQLAGAEMPIEFQPAVSNIPVRQKAKKIHFLHAAAYEWIPKDPETKVIANYYVDYVDGRRLSMPIIYGRDIADWWFDPAKPMEPSHASLAWEGTNPAAQAYGTRLRLYRMEWENPSVDVEIGSLSAQSMLKLSAPFLVGITIEP